jgi:hypothetical protein
MNTCLYCQREFSNKGGLGAHQPFCKSNPSRVQRIKSPNAHPKKGTIPWNKGLTVANSPSLARSTETKAKLSSISSNRTQTLETKHLLSKIAKERKLGGYTQGSGRGKKGWYKGFFCDSSWELAYVIFCLDHDVSIKRNTEKRQYLFKDKVKNYIPDFIVETDLIEIKGYKTEEWEAKIKCNPDVKVLYKEDLSEIFSYVINTYGKKYIELYE